MAVVGQDVKASVKNAYSALCDRLHVADERQMLIWQRTCLEVTSAEYISIIDELNANRSACAAISNCLGVSRKDADRRARDFIISCGRWIKCCEQSQSGMRPRPPPLEMPTSPIMHATCIAKKETACRPAESESQLVLQYMRTTTPESDSNDSPVST